MAGCNTGRNIQKYKGSGGGASTLQEALENSNIATIDINLISGAKFRGDGSALTGISGSGGAVGNLQQVTNQDNQTTNEIIITNTGTSLSASGAISASGNITAPSFIGSGSSLTGLNATNIASGTLNINRGGTGVTTGLTQLNAGNITSGTVPLARGGTGATSASTAADNLGLGTGDSPEFTGVNIGHASDTTITRSSAGVIAVEGQIVRTGDVALGTETSGDYVATITGGDGIASTGATTGETISHSLSVDTKANGGLAIENGKLALKLNDPSITGELGIGDGGTGVTTGLTQLNAGNLTIGTVPVARGGTGVATGLTVLDPNNLSGTVPLTKGGTGQTTASAAATALGLGTNDSPQFTGISLGSTAITESLGTVSIGGSAIITGSIALGTDTSGDYVTTITGGDGIASTGATTGENVAHSLSVDTKTNGGLAIENGKLALKLNDQSITGELSISDGGTGATTASGAATALGLGTGDSPQFSSIELGHSSDTTIARSGAGKVTIQGHEIRTGTVESDKGGTGQTSYNVGEILVANDPNNTGTPTLYKLTPGSSGYFLKSTGNGSFPIWDSVASVGSPTPGQLFTGTGLTGANASGNPPTGGHTGASDTTISVDAATGNVANKLVMRDASGDIRVQEVIVGTTGGTTGSLTSTAWSGSAATLTNARNIGGVSFDGSASISLPGVNAPGTQDTSGNAATATQLASAVNIGGVSFDGSASISLPGVNAPGTQDTSGKAGSITNAADTTTNADQNVAFLNGDNVKTNTNLTINPSTGELKATQFTAGANGFVDSNLTNKGAVYVDSNGKLVTTAAGTIGQVLEADANGIPVWSNSGGQWTKQGTLIYYNTGNVGIGTQTPAHRLDVNGTVNATSFRGDGSNLTNVQAGSLTNEASRSITVSTITAQGGSWDVR